MKLNLRLLLTVLAVIALIALPALGADTPAAAGEDHGGEAGTSLFDSPSAATLATSLITIVIFLLLLAVLAKYAWGPIVAGLEARENRIRADVEAAEKARADAEAARAEYQSQIADAEQRQRDMMAQATTDANKLRDRKMQDAEHEVREFREKNMREIEQAKRDAVAEVRREAAVMAVAIAEKILQREVSQEDQKQLIEESLNEFEKVGAEQNA